MKALILALTLISSVSFAASVGGKKVYLEGGKEITKGDAVRSLAAGKKVLVKTTDCDALLSDSGTIKCK